MSKASDDFLVNIDDNIQNILDVARVKNSEVGITGILIYRNGLFLQMLEGEEEAVHELYGKIASDDRHCELKTLFKQEASERLFSFWFMGFARLNDNHLKDVEGILPWDDLAEFMNQGQAIPNQKILDFLKTFRFKEAA